MKYHLIRRWEDWDQEFDPDQIIFSDTETCVEQGKTRGGLYGEVRLFQACQESLGSDTAYLFDCRFLGLEKVLELFKDHHLVFHNASYDLHTINCHTPELWLPQEVDDTVYLSRLALYAKGSKFGFYQCLKYCKIFNVELQGIDKSENQKADWGGPLSNVMLDYAAWDVVKLKQLYEHVNHMKSTQTYMLDIGNLKYAVEYSRRGIPTGKEKVHEMLLEQTEKLETILEELPVNPNSPKQCKTLLNAPASDVETLARLALEGVPWAEEIREARKLSKTVGFLKKYSRPVIKGFYNPSAAVSGRWSCTGGDRYTHENLQQIPRRLLNCLQAPEGKVFIYKDYSGLELRMTVAWTGEPVMASLMIDGIDVHTFTGASLFQVLMEELTKHQRNVSKTFTFASLYGAMAKMIAQILRTNSGIIIPIKEINILMKRYFDTYEYFKEWHAMHKRHLQVHGFLDVTTALGRTVRTYGLTDSLAIPIQGSASEVTKFSLMLLKDRYPNENLISTIHDSNTLLVDEAEADIWIDRLNECMLEAWYYVIKDLAIPDLPMPAEAEKGKIWDF